MPIPRRKSDELLKGVTEENLPDLLTFLYPDAAALFDLERGVTLLDKELHAIIPDREQKSAKTHRIPGKCTRYRAAFPLPGLSHI